MLDRADIGRTRVLLCSTSASISDHPSAGATQFGAICRASRKRGPSVGRAAVPVYDTSRRRGTHSTPIRSGERMLPLIRAVIGVSGYALERMRSNTFDPVRFLTAQAPVYSDVVQQLHAGRKTSHWMWFIFPQLAGLGRSAMSARYALENLDEAKEFVAHPVLGARLHECVALVNALTGKRAHEIFGSPDDLKFHSSMTLFSIADPTERSFSEALAKYFDAEPDRLTLAKLGL